LWAIFDVFHDACEQRAMTVFLHIVWAVEHPLDLVDACLAVCGYVDGSFGEGHPDSC